MPLDTVNKYDFREGINLDKIVYKETTIRWENAIYYTLLMFSTWLYAFGFLCLNFFLISNYEPVVRWIFLGQWLVWIFSIIIIGGYNLMNHYKLKDEKRKLKTDAAEAKLAAMRAKIENKKSAALSRSHKQDK